MTDTQHYFDLARAQLNTLSTDIERHFDSLASHLREWLPYDSVTNTISLSSPRRPAPPPTTLELVQRWVSRHKALTAAIAAFVVTGGVGTWVYIAQNNGRRRKRRARKSASGARLDVVVVAGAVANPLASALYLDLERRGFVVYVVSQTSEEERYVRSQNRADLLPLRLDLGDAQAQMRKFHGLLGREHRAFEGAETHRLRLAGLVLVPETESVPARIDDLSAEEWSDALNAKVLSTIATTQLFLPSVVDQGAKVLLLTPNVVPALKMPGRGVESVVYGALESFVASLRAEMGETAPGVGVVHFKMGCIDVPSVTARQRREGAPASRVRATPQRRLHDAVFDALVGGKGRGTWYVGRGSWAYEVVGRWVPRGLVGWMVSGAGLTGGCRRDVGGSGLPLGRRGSEGSEEIAEGSRSLEWEKVEGEWMRGDESRERDGLADVV